MTELMHESDCLESDPDMSSAMKKPGILGSVALLILLTGCANAGVQGQLFDHQSATIQNSDTTPAKAGASNEQPKPMSASALLGRSQAGPGYKINPTVVNNGRYNTYTFETERGTYSVTGDVLARKHIQELAALEALKTYSPTAEFAHGAGDAVTGPAKGVFTQS